MLTRSLGVMAFLVSFLTLCSGCLDRQTLLSLQSGLSSGGGGSNAVSNSLFSVSQPAAQSLILSSNQSIPVTVSASSNFSGVVNLSIVQDELSLIDPAGYVAIKLSQPSINLSPGGSANVMVTIKVDPMAPSFTGSHFHFVATQAAGAVTPAVVNVDIPLEVKATYEVDIFGPAAAPENWSVPVGAMINFRNHPEGVLVNFVNMDTVNEHIVHSVGVIPHQNTATPLLPATATAPGGNYQYLVTVQTVATDQFYCHLHESTTQIRNMSFNTPNPNATFTAITNNIFKVSCAGCHMNGNNSGGVNFDTYANTLKVVVANNPSSSGLYTSTSSGLMPVSGAKLSGALLQDILDWINSGAPNN